MATLDPSIHYACTLAKKGGGASFLFGRRSWKRRFFVFDKSEKMLSYWESEAHMTAGSPPLKPPLLLTGAEVELPKASEEQGKDKDGKIVWPFTLRFHDEKSSRSHMPLRADDKATRDAVVAFLGKCGVKTIGEWLLVWRNKAGSPLSVVRSSHFFTSSLSFFFIRFVCRQRRNCSWQRHAYSFLLHSRGGRRRLLFFLFFPPFRRQHESEWRPADDALDRFQARHLGLPVLFFFLFFLFFERIRISRGRVSGAKVAAASSPANNQQQHGHREPVFLRQARVSSDNKKYQRRVW